MACEIEITEGTVAAFKALIQSCLDELDIPDPDGSSAFGVVAADGTVTLPDGSTAPAVDGQGNTIPPGETVLSIFDGDGNYLGSKVCDTTPLAQALDKAGTPLTQDYTPVLGDAQLEQFTDGSSDVTDANCRSEVACGADGRLHAPAQRHAVCASGRSTPPVYVHGAAPSDAAPANSVVVGPLSPVEVIIVNPSLCREMCVTKTYTGYTLNVEWIGNLTQAGIVDTRVNVSHECDGAILNLSNQINNARVRRWPAREIGSFEVSTNGHAHTKKIAPGAVTTARSVAEMQFNGSLSYQNSVEFASISVMGVNC